MVHCTVAVRYVCARVRFCLSYDLLVRLSARVSMWNSVLSTIISHMWCMESRIWDTFRREVPSLVVHHEHIHVQITVVLQDTTNALFVYIYNILITRKFYFSIEGSSFIFHLPIIILTNHQLSRHQNCFQRFCLYITLDISSRS